MLSYFENWKFHVEALTDMLNPNCAVTPCIYVGVMEGIWDVSEDLDLANYPLVSLVVGYTNSSILFPGRSVVCS